MAATGAPISSALDPASIQADHQQMYFFRFLVVLSVLLSGCATPPATYNVVNSRTIHKPYDVVWENLVGYFASRSLPLKTVAKDSGVLYAEINGYTPNLVDCGKISMGFQNGGLASVNVFVARAAGDPMVTVTARFVTFWQSVGSPWQPGGIQTPCESRGILEAEILDAAAK
jgi:hypothetical protein